MDAAHTAPPKAAETARNTTKERRNLVSPPKAAMGRKTSAAVTRQQRKAKASRPRLGERAKGLGTKAARPFYFFSKSQARASTAGISSIRLTTLPLRSSSVWRMR